MKQFVAVIFGLGLLCNALLFVPQALALWRKKTDEGISLITFGGFSVLQAIGIVHGIYQQDLSLEPVINFPAVGAGRQFFSFREARSDAYRVSASDERQRNGENWPQPFGLRRKSRHTLLSSSTVVPPQPSDSASSGPIFARNADHAKVNNRL